MISKKTSEYQTYLGLKPRVGMVNKLTALEKEVQKTVEIELVYEKNRLLKEMQNEINNFDSRVDK
jgi:hypothetical protein